MTDRFEITTDLDDPFFLGQIIGPENAGLPVSIAGHGFMVDLSEELGFYHRYQVTSINLLNTQQAQSSDDSSQVPPEIWRRITESWDQGAGQASVDRKDSSPNRFYTSTNIDVWTPWRASLLHDVTQIHTLPAGRSFLLTCGPNQLVAAAGSTMYWWGADLTVAPTTVTLPGTGSPTIVDMCTDGAHLYTLGTDGKVRQWTNASTSIDWMPASPVSGDYTRMLLRYLKGFLVLGRENVLYDITAKTLAAIWTNPLASFTWRDGCEGPAGYLLGGQGDRWAVYSIMPKADATTLDVPTQAVPIPDGEVGYAIASYLNYVLVGLNTGWRFGATDPQGNVTLGRLVATDNPVRCFEGQDRFVWYGRSSSTATPPAGLGRADLSTFTGPLTPAYANDLQTTVTAGTVSAATSYYVAAGGLGKRVFTIDGVGVYAEQNTLAASGTLEVGSTSFGTSDQKMGIYAQMYTNPLAGSVDIDVAYDNEDAYGHLATFDLQGAVTAGKIYLDQAFDRIRTRFTLNRSSSDATAGPTLARWEVRAIPIAGRVREFRIPLIIAEEYGEPVSLVRNVQADLELLDLLIRTRESFIYRVGYNQFRVYAADFTWLPHRFTWDRQHLEGTFILIAREVG